MYTGCGEDGSTNYQHVVLVEVVPAKASIFLIWLSSRVFSFPITYSFLARIMHFPRLTEVRGGVDEGIVLADGCAGFFCVTPEPPTALAVFIFSVEAQKNCYFFFIPIHSEISP